MAEIRYIKTKMWRDTWFNNLNQKQQHLFMFLVTNEATRLSGFYEMQLEQIALSTKNKPKEVAEAIKGLSPRILYIDGWVCIKNYAKHQNAANSPKVQTLIEKDLKDVPNQIIDQANSSFNSHSNSSFHSVGIDTPSIGYQDMAKNKDVGDKPVDKDEDKVKKKYGEFKNVLLTDEQKEKLKVRYGRDVAMGLVEELSVGIESKGYKYKSHYATIIAWAKKKGVQIVTSTKEPKLIPEMQSNGTVRLVANPSYHE